MLKSFDYKILIFLAFVMGLAPFHPMPHLFEKLQMLVEGELRRPVDIFDLVMHSAPFVLLLVKYLYDQKQKRKQESTSL